MSRTSGGAYQSGDKPVEDLRPPPTGIALGAPKLATVAEHLKALAEECDVPKNERRKYMVPKGREYRVALHWRAVGLREAALILERTDA